MLKSQQLVISRAPTGIFLIRSFSVNSKLYSASSKLASNEKSSKDAKKIPSPRQLKEYLDQYIIGQEIGKKVLSVAVYNHYLRINDKQKKIQKAAELELLEKELKEKEVDPADPVYSGTSESLAGIKNLRRQLEIAKANEDNDLTLSKSNVLVVGPTGSGKTLLASTLARVLDVPIVITDCTQLTQAGYIGDDVEKCIEKLLVDADFDVAKAERGIVVLDEIDKLAKSSKNIMSKDVSGEGVQQSLLKIIEGHQVEVVAKRPIKVKFDEKNNKSVGKKEETYIVDTSNILFMIMGAFVGLDKHISTRISNMKLEKEQENKTKKGEPKSEKRKLTEENSEDVKEISNNKIDEITLDNGKTIPALNLTSPADLISFGIIPELVGRVPIVTALQPLHQKDLFHILKEPKNALLNQYIYIFKQFGVDLYVTDKALTRVADFALKEGTGARGLRGIMERLLLNVNYECPDNDIAYVLVNEDTVKSLQQTEYSLATHVEAKFYTKDEVNLLLEGLQKEDAKLAERLKRKLNRKSF
ncbi:hypothetical protein TPHA_0J01840 [Tetrapisispora phaffii CBS 4417]|uniref:AAA+ ATPase domain-containing protein n=1 Tax=Tetrapisispora phaffii (strain ATCC 24235 / CBS 4417 / NBRC 1672 / NRRL Y-8282 / UCD 70-5) TaxID=1071381 RepID=G8BYR3_TETPH|nr:hypothetical protein TPHA_0J01840 [Tetrapisispora phaffii CBS 4417]CCE65005.1 hypothetical protein TPHA_0J01840 [Tetrapisispora phaffii CBS 4417]